MERDHHDLGDVFGKFEFQGRQTLKTAGYVA